MDVKFKVNRSLCRPKSSGLEEKDDSYLVTIQEKGLLGSF